MSVVYLDHVVKIFAAGTRREVRAVDDFSLAVERGELVTLLGPSGCGKTTTLRILAGFELPTSGDVYIEGQKMTHVPPQKRPVSRYGGSRVGRSKSGFPRCSAWWACKDWRTVGWGSSPADSSSGWPYVGPSLSSPRCSCSTSPSRIWTPSSGKVPESRFAASKRNWGSRACTSPMIRRRR